LKKIKKKKKNKGGYLNEKIFIPKSVWFQERTNEILNNSKKYQLCNSITESLEKLKNCKEENLREKLNEFSIIFGLEIDKFKNSINSIVFFIYFIKIKKKVKIY
jgi:hypothetical protein